MINLNDSKPEANEYSSARHRHPRCRGQSLMYSQHHQYDQRQQQIAFTELQVGLISSSDLTGKLQQSLMKMQDKTSKRKTAS